MQLLPLQCCSPYDQKHPTPLPRPCKTMKNSANNLKPAASNSQQAIQRKISVPTCLQKTKNSPLLPTPPAPVKPQPRKQYHPGPPPCSDRHYK